MELLLHMLTYKIYILHLCTLILFLQEISLLNYEQYRCNYWPPECR
jgi:hypothetical protein